MDDSNSDMSFHRSVKYVGQFALATPFDGERIAVARSRHFAQA
jgi:hypothetical protein